MTAGAPGSRDAICRRPGNGEYGGGSGPRWAQAAHGGTFGPHPRGL